MTDTLSIAQGRQTDGTLEHVGRLIVRRRLATGVLATVTLPDDWTSLPAGPAGPVGPAGPTGATGPAGATGPGVATGGTTGQLLTKTSATDFATAWQDPVVTLAAFNALAARVTALEAKVIPNSIEDLTYAG